MYLMPLFVKEKLKINIFHLNIVTRILATKHNFLVHTHHLSIFSSLIHQFLCTTSKIVNIFASLSIHSFHIHKSDQFINCYQLPVTLGVCR